jgi:hypothetical protein
MRIGKEGTDLLVTIPRGIPMDLRGAALLAVTAQPPTCADDPETLKVFQAIGRLGADVHLRNEPSLRRQMLPYPADVQMTSLTDARRIQKQVMRKIGQRKAAADALAPAIDPAWKIFNGERVAGQTTMTTRGLVRRYLRAEHDRLEKYKKIGEPLESCFALDEVNFETRVLRPSLPVMHLGIALSWAVLWATGQIRGASEEIHRSFSYEMREGVFLPKFGFMDLYFTKEVQDFILTSAEHFESLVPLMQPASRRGWVWVREG